VHTTSYTFAFLLHHLACTPRVQELLHEEARILHQEVAGGEEGEEGWMTRDLLARAVYARACLRQRETHNENLSSKHFKGRVQQDFLKLAVFSIL
jgi:hypothetical protein